MGEDHTSVGESLSSTKTYKVYSYRYVASVIYAISAIVNSVLWITTSPLQTNLQTAYGLSSIIINLGTSLNYLIIFPPMTFLSNYIIDELGIRPSILIGNFLTIIGMWMRTLSNDSFYYIFAGQVLGAIGGPCILNTPQKVSAVWYPPEERTISTTLLSIASPFGVAIGFFLPTIFVPATVADTAADKTYYLQQVQHLMLIVAIGGTALLLPSFFLMKEKPLTPPSKAAEKEKFSYKDSLKSLIRNKNFLVFLATVGFTWGVYNVLATTMNPLIAPFNYTSADSGIYGAVTLLMGMVGSPIWGIYVGRTKQYKRSLITLSSLSTMMLIVLLFVGQHGNKIITGIFIAIYGFVTTPMLPLIFEMCCEITFPVAEANAGGITYMITQVTGVIGAFLVNLLLDSTPTGSIKGFIVLIVFQALGVLGFVSVKEDLRRTKYEQGEALEYESTSTENSKITGNAEYVSLNE